MGWSDAYVKTRISDTANLLANLTGYRERERERIVSLASYFYKYWGLMTRPSDD